MSLKIKCLLETAMKKIIYYDLSQATFKLVKIKQDDISSYEESHPNYILIDFPETDLKKVKLTNVINKLNKHLKEASMAYSLN